jgi:FtsZ-interacting cell division protein ZipA
VVVGLAVKIQYFHDKRYGEDTKERADECCAMNRYEDECNGNHQQRKGHPRHQAAERNGEKLIPVSLPQSQAVREQTRRCVNNRESDSNPYTHPHRIRHIVSCNRQFLEMGGWMGDAATSNQRAHDVRP